MFNRVEFIPFLQSQRDHNVRNEHGIDGAENEQTVPAIAPVPYCTSQGRKMNIHNLIYIGHICIA